MRGQPRTDPSVFHEENKKRREDIQKVKESQTKVITGQPKNPKFKNEKTDKYVLQRFERELKEAE